MTKLYPTQNHPSSFHRQQIVYPVVSRRSGGVSIGINLSPSKRCSFACIYCQVPYQRRRQEDLFRGLSPSVDLHELETEIRNTVDVVQSGRLFEEERFKETLPEKRELHDFAFSGDGEPTLSPQFADAVKIVTRLKKELTPESVKMVLITNATHLQAKDTIRGCDTLSENNGEIWAKLDAGSDELYQRMNRSIVPFGTVLENIAFAAMRWPVKIQTMFLRHGEYFPSQNEIDSYVRAICDIGEKGGKIMGLQLYTVARPPVESNVFPLSDEQMDRLAEEIGIRTGIAASVFYSR